MSIITELAFCWTCSRVTPHIVTVKSDGEITSLLCRRCKHKHVVGSNDNV